MHVFMIGSGPFDPTHFKTYVKKQVPANEQAIFIGVDLGAQRYVEMQQTMHLAIGDFDSITETMYQKVYQQAQTVKRLQPMKDETDMEAALTAVIAQYPQATYHLFGALGGRVDHSMSNLWLAFHPAFKAQLTQIRLVNPKNTVRFLKPGEFQIDQLTDMTYLSFITLTPVTGLTLRNVVYPLDNKDYSYPIALISNEFLPEQQTMTGTFTSGLIAVVQAKD